MFQPGALLRWPSFAAVVAVFVAGGIAGSAFDQIHVVGGVLHYPEPDFLGQPWWVYPQFGVAGVAMTLSWFTIARVRRIDERPKSLSSVETSLVWFVAAYLASVVFRAFPFEVAVALGATFLLRTFADRPVETIVHALGAALVGVAWEISLSSRGVFHYDAPSTLVSVPIWLPGLYFHAAMFLRDVARLMIR